MAHQNQIQYKIEKGIESPFKLTQKKGPSSSNWGSKHLNWLHVLLELDCNWTELFSSESELSTSSRVAIHLKENLDKDWKWICETEHVDGASIYALLACLATEAYRKGDWETETQASATPPSSVRGQSM